MRKNGLIPIILIIVLTLSLLSGTAYAKYNSDDYSNGIVQLNVAHTVTVPELDNAEFLIWSSAGAFAIGIQEEKVRHFITDGAAFDPYIALEELAEKFAAYYENDGLTFNYDEFIKTAIVSEVDLYIAYNNTNIKVEVVGQVNQSSIAVLALPENVSPIDATPLRLADTTFTEPGDNVHTFRFKGEDLFGIVEAGGDAYITTWQYESCDTKLEYVGTSQTTGYPACSCELVKSRNLQGMPLFNDSGAVIAINTYEAGSLNLVSLLNDPILKLLTGYEIPHEISDAEESVLPDLTDLIKYVSVLVGAIIILIALLLVLRARRKSRETEEEDMEPDEEQEYELSRRRRKAAVKQAASNEQPAVVMPPLKPAQDVPGDMAETIEYHAVNPADNKNVVVRPLRAVLRSISGSLVGRYFTVSGRVVIGRDPTLAKVLFEPTYTVISKRHCCVSYTPETGRITLEDLNSSNGTYFENGERLIPGKVYSINEGDTFYLGLPENMFRITM
ncbi:MAG: FHA domain-containing protein [Clostridiales bacterium]|nr:FHA domain-containing protein [Clostridiales bacterium]